MERREKIGKMFTFMRQCHALLFIKNGKETRLPTEANGKSLFFATVFTFNNKNGYYYSLQCFENCHYGRSSATNYVIQNYLCVSLSRKFRLFAILLMHKLFNNDFSCMHFSQDLKFTFYLIPLIIPLIDHYGSVYRESFEVFFFIVFRSLLCL